MTVLSGHAVYCYMSPPECLVSNFRQYEI